MAIMGSGAGGSGAGGSGAGGSGAGGSGAGGSGAGGSGAGGHAGGPSSGMLNTALTITSDAISGFWDGSADRTPPAKPHGYDELTYLSPSRRMSMFAAETLGVFSVSESAPQTAVVHLLDQQVSQTKTPEHPFFDAQLMWLRNYADLRVDRIPEINVQIVDLLSFFGMVGQLDAGEHKYTLEALGVVQDVTYSVTMQVKHHCWAARPIAYSQRVHPIIQTPDHSTFPSAHASEAFAIATVLEHIINLKTKCGTVVGPSMAMRVAHRIASNRTIAGVHFPVDSFAGAQLGIAMGHAMLALLFPDHKMQSTEFVPDTPFKKEDDFLLSALPGGTDLSALDAEDIGPLAKIYGKCIKNEWGL